MTAADARRAKLRRHREEMELAVANGWPLARAKAELSRRRAHASAAALEAVKRDLRNGTGRFAPRPLSPDEIERSDRWMMRD